MNCVKNEQNIFRANHLDKSAGNIAGNGNRSYPIEPIYWMRKSRFWKLQLNTITCFYSAKKRRMNQRSIRSNNLANSLMRFTLFADLNLDGRGYERLLKKSILWTFGVNCVQGQRVANKTFQKSRKTDTSCCMIYLSQLAVAVDAKLPALPYFGSWRYFTYTRRVTVLSYIWRVIANLNGQI